MVFHPKKTNKGIYKSKNMKNLIALQIFALFALAASCDTDDAINGSGNLTTESRDVEAFTKVSSEGVFEVAINQGPEQSVEITADDNVIGRVRTRVVNDELQLYLDDDYSYSGITLRVQISAKSLSGLYNSGAGNMEVTKVDQPGVFTIGNFGSGNISIQGTALSLNIKNEGSGNIRAFDFPVENCSVDIEGSGNAEVHCSDDLEVSIEGSGNVFYKGSPSINASISGSGKVIDAN